MNRHQPHAKGSRGPARMRAEDWRTLRTLKSRLVAAGLSIREVWAFGRRGRGTCDEESDLDVFIVLGGRSRTTEKDIDRIAWELGVEAGYVTTTIECTEEELRGLPLGVSPLLEVVRREGVQA